MAASEFFRGSARSEFSGESNFTSVGGNSSSSAVQHILNINQPSNVYVYHYGTSPNSPIAQAWPPVNVNVNGTGQHPSTGHSSSNSQVPPSGEGRVEGSQGGANADEVLGLNGDALANPNIKKPVQQTLLDRIRAFFRALRRL
ncbi:hypothetical protein V5O48_010450 [Marasmius crinis-equi]|uniref:Uncharacterized protein n=1 Tax=Marasmius crinis-equi TaxID=585013 RepID=A0ABR3F8E9_9AGAR